jgi:hypothetical protein
MTNDDDSFESLLSDWNDSNDDEEENDYDGEDEFEQLKQKFVFRDMLLKRMTQGKDSCYVEMCLQHESLMRAEALKLLETDSALKKDLGEKIKSVNHVKGKKIISSPIKCMHCLVFETQLALPGLVAVLFYCSAHLAAYQFVESIVLERTRIFRNSREEDMYYFACVIASLILTRLTGGVWDWVNLDRHEVAKAELDNRFRLRYWDAKLHLWFRKHRVIKLICDYTSLYICLVGVGYFHYRLFGPLFEDRTWITENLPSRVHGIETSISMSLNRRFAPECQDEADQSCSLLVEMTRQDEKHLYSQVSISSFLGIMGYSGAHAATPIAIQALTLSVTCLGVFVLQKLGYEWD